MWVVQYLQYPNPAGPEDAEPRQVLARRLRQGAAAAAEPRSRRGQDHHPRGHRRRRRLRQAQDVRRWPEHRHVGRPRPRRRLGAQSAVPALLSRPRTTTTCPTAIRSCISAGLRPRRHALRRQQPALGPRRLAVRRPGQHGHRHDQAARRQGAHRSHGGQHIWRYHPEKKQFEIFAEGGGNAFGVEIDARAASSPATTAATRAASTTCRAATIARASTSTAHSRTPMPSATSRR